MLSVGKRDVTSHHRLTNHLACAKIQIEGSCNFMVQLALPHQVIKDGEFENGVGR